MKKDHVSSCNRQAVIALAPFAASLRAGFRRTITVADSARDRDGGVRRARTRSRRTRTMI
jgi:hypothetical protein